MFLEVILAYCIARVGIGLTEKFYVCFNATYIFEIPFSIIHGFAWGILVFINTSKLLRRRHFCR